LSPAISRLLSVESALERWADPYYRAIESTIPFAVVWFKERYKLAISDERLKNVTLEEIYLDIVMTLLHKDASDIDDFKKMTPDELQSELNYLLDPSDESIIKMQEAITEQFKEAGIYNNIIDVLKNLPPDSHG
jgi:hypothetical protein